MEKNEQAVQAIDDCLTEFMFDPFDDVNETLRSLKSGIPASNSLALDRMEYTKAQDFMAETVYSKKKSLNDRVYCDKHKKIKLRYQKSSRG